MIVVIVWIFFALVLAMTAKGNGRSFWGWFILALLIDPILAFVLYKLITD